MLIWNFLNVLAHLLTQIIYIKTGKGFLFLQKSYYCLKIEVIYLFILFIYSFFFDIIKYCENYEIWAKLKHVFARGVSCNYKHIKVVVTWCPALFITGMPAIRWLKMRMYKFHFNILILVTFILYNFYPGQLIIKACYK